jgi:hypothetical protein
MCLSSHAPHRGPGGNTIGRIRMKEQMMNSNQLKVTVLGLIATAALAAYAPARADEDSVHWFLTQLQMTDGYMPSRANTDASDNALNAEKKESGKASENKVATAKPAKD